MPAVPLRALALAAGCCAIGALAAAPAAHATFPGRNGVIAYTRFSDQPDVWTINADGNGATPIISSPNFDFVGGWSGNGERIAYFTNALVTGEYDLWTADAGGSNPQHALHPLDFPDDLVPAVSQDPSLSPDGNTIVFDNQRGIHTVPVGGGPVTTLEPGSSSSFHNYPVYSPDGTQIAYGHFFPDTGTGRIEILDVANPGNRTIVTDPAEGVTDQQPDWSPDGSKIVFTRFVNGIGSHIYVIDVGSAPGSEQDITPNPDRDTNTVSWSPDGTKILYRENDRTMVMDADGLNPHAVGDPEPSGTTDYQPHWQPLPAIHLEKTGPASATAGDTVPFNLTVTNPGDGPLYDVSVSDPGCDAAPPTLVGKSGDATPDTFDPGDVWNFTCSATAGAGDVVHNVATVYATMASGGQVSDSDDADVPIGIHAEFGPGGGTASTGSDTTSSDPTNAEITTPVASSITIVQPATLDGAPTGFEFVGSQFNIDATSGGDPVQAPATNPFRLVFTVDASLVPSTGVDSLEAFRDGAVIPPCLAAGTANPDPCVADRTIVAGTGDAKITVLSTHASHWNLGLSSVPPYGFTGFASPIGSGLNKVKAGSEILLKFGLGGNQGLAIFAAGYPTVQPIDCATRAATGPALQTTTGTLASDRKANKYTYAWKSPKSLSGCFALNLKTNDGVPHVAQFTSR